MARYALPRLLILTALTAGLAGCSKSPTAPQVDGLTNSPAAAAGIIQVSDPVLEQEGAPGAVTSMTLNARQAGIITMGKFRLVIPKNALRQTATITMVQPNPAVMQVEFNVTPAEANAFRTPVKLIADCSDDGLEQVTQETVYWWSGTWNPASSVVLDSTARTLTTSARSLRNGKVDLRPGGGRTRTDG